MSNKVKTRASERNKMDTDAKRHDSAVQTEGLTETDAWFSQSAVTLDANEEYKMNHKRRGVALIFNQENFYWHLRLNSRSGTNADKNNLVKSFSALGFDVKEYNDLKQKEILQILKETANENHSNADSFVCVFLSHGDDGHVFAYDDKIEIKDITALFRGTNCNSLVGKPKIFILQACRGDKHDDPVTSMDVVDSKIVNEVAVDAAVVHTLPAGADFIMCYSVAEGFYSHRETVNGSWYIQDLCAMLQQYGSTLEFTELLTLVNRKVSHRSVGNCLDRSAIGKKQVPCFASMFTKKLYFRPKK